MSGLSIQSGEWVVVCDGAKALVLENVGDTKFPNLKTVEVFEQDDKPTHRCAWPLAQFGRSWPQRDGADRLARPGGTGIPHQGR